MVAKKDKAMKKVSFKMRFKHLKDIKFQGKLMSGDDSTAGIIYNEKLIGIGVKIKTKGFMFRALFSSDDAKKRAYFIQEKTGSVFLTCKTLGDKTVAVVSSTYPHNSVTKIARKYRAMEKREWEDHKRDNINVCFTGKHRSSDSVVSGFSKPINVTRKPKNKEY